MDNEQFVGNLAIFLNFILKFVGLAPFYYAKSKRLFISCRCYTIMSCVIGGIIITVSLPIEFISALNFKPFRLNTVSYAMGYLHIFFTLVKIWFNQILTIAHRNKIIKHLNQAFYINDYLKNLCQNVHILDDKLIRMIKLRIFLFIFQSVTIVYGVNAYISRSFFQYNAILWVKVFISFSYVNSIFVTTIYLGGSLMMCDRYCRILYKRVQDSVKEIKEKCFNTTPMNQCYNEFKLNDSFDQISEVYNQVVMFISNSHTLFSCQGVICACSTFLIGLHGVRF